MQLFFLAKTHKGSQHTSTIFVHQLSKKKKKQPELPHMFLSVYLDFFVFQGEDALWRKPDQESRGSV